MIRTSVLAAAVALGLGSAVSAAEHTVLFDLGSAALGSEARAVLEAAAQDYRATGSTAVSLVGHTDTTGSADYNMRLSQRRAEAAANALVGMGVPASAMSLAWRGQDDLAVATGDNVAERRNRRVELTIGEPPAAETPVPQTVEEVVSRLRFGLGPYVAFNSQHNDNSTFVGGNLMVTYDIDETFSVSAEQAVFYTLDARDDGWGSRTAIGGEARFGDMGGFEPYVGVNGGRYWIGGTGTGGWFAGPELGVRVGALDFKAAYDIVEPRAWENGVFSFSVGYTLPF